MDSPRGLRLLVITDTLAMDGKQSYDDLTSIIQNPPPWSLNNIPLVPFQLSMLIFSIFSQPVLLFIVLVRRELVRLPHADPFVLSWLGLVQLSRVDPLVLHLAIPELKCH